MKNILNENREYKTTTNSFVYNRLRKQYLENNGDIHCSWCPYHENENYVGKWYGGFDDGYQKSRDRVCYPSWKLYTKNRKQWEYKKIKIKKDKRSFTFVF